MSLDARDPCPVRVSTVSSGFESRPQRSTRCQNYNVRPGQKHFRVTDRSSMFLFLFKPFAELDAVQSGDVTDGCRGTVALTWLGVREIEVPSRFEFRLFGRVR